MIRKVVTAGLAGIVLLLAAAVVAVEARWARTFEAPYPAIHATTDPALVERGRYLAYGPASCAYCHVPKSEWPKLDRGEMPALTGAHEFPLPFGAFYSANLTALLSFLRAQPAVRSEVPEHRHDLMGKAIFAFVIEPAPAPPRYSPRGVTAERGEYLANDVSLCVACHTNRNLMDGSFTGSLPAG